MPLPMAGPGIILAGNGIDRVGNEIRLAQHQGCGPHADRARGQVGQFGVRFGQLTGDVLEHQHAVDDGAAPIILESATKRVLAANAMPLAAPITVLLELGSAVVNVTWPITARAACPFTKSAAYKAAEQKMITGIHFMSNV